MRRADRPDPCLAGEMTGILRPEQFDELRPLHVAGRRPVNADDSFAGAQEVEQTFLQPWFAGSGLGLLVRAQFVQITRQ